MSPNPAATLPRPMRAQGHEVQSFYQRGLTWVTLIPLPVIP
jgi:hypothetical protein